MPAYPADASLSADASIPMLMPVYPTDAGFLLPMPVFSPMSHLFVSTRFWLNGGEMLPNFLGGKIGFNRGEMLPNFFGG